MSIRSNQVYQEESVPFDVGDQLFREGHRQDSQCLATIV